MITDGRAVGNLSLGNQAAADRGWGERPALHLRAFASILERSVSPAPELDQVTDEALARSIALGAPDDRRAAEAELCRRFLPRVRLYGLRHLRSDPKANDLAQRVLLVTLEQLRAGKVRDPSRLASFILGVARRVTLEMQRDPDLRTVTTDFGIGPPLGSSPAPELEPLARRRLAEGLAQLDERERTILLLSFCHEQSSREIAQALGMTEGNVRVVRYRAIERLRQSFADCGWEDTP